MTDPSLSQGSVPPAGWYHDPAHPGRQRWWDGVTWSSQVRMATAPRATGHGGPLPGGSAAAPSPIARGGFRLIQRPAPVVPPDRGGYAVGSAVPVGGSVVLASLGRRVVATLIDWLLVAALVFAVAPLLVSDFQQRYWGAIWTWSQAAAAASGQVGPMTDDLRHVGELLTYFLMGATLIYSFVALALYSRTLGQRLLGIAVSPLDKPGEKVGWNRGLARSLGWTLLSQGGGLFLILNAFSISMALWHPKRQTIPDLLARTQVVRRA